MTRVALDSNILIYLAGVSRHPSDDSKVEAIDALVDRLRGRADLIAPAQTLGEMFTVLRKAGATAEDARAILLKFAEAFEVVPSNATTALVAADLVVAHKLQYWDALIVNAAIEAGCTILLSEDMQHGFVAGGLTIVNPLVQPLHPKLSELLAD